MSVSNSPTPARPARPLVDPWATVSDIVLQFPNSMHVFKAAGIETCCNGKRPVADAARDANVSLGSLLDAIAASAE